MMENINIALQELIGNAEGMQLPPDFKEMEAALSEYNKLVKRGLIVPRGYNLLTINDNPVQQQLNTENANARPTAQRCEIEIE